MVDGTGPGKVRPGHGSWPRELLRTEDSWLAAGGGQYLANAGPADALHCVFFRSPEPLGVLRSVDVSAALNAPGVTAAYTAADLPLADVAARPVTKQQVEVNQAMGRPHLARDRVRFVGEAVALVVADTEAHAVDAVELISADIDPLPAVLDARRAIRGDCLLFEEAGTNVASSNAARVTGGAPASAAKEGSWPVEVQLRVRHPRLAAVPIEPPGIVVSPDGSGGITAWCGHQSPHRLRDQLAVHLQLAKERVRVIVPDVGGGFGLKQHYFPEYPVVAWAAVHLGRPVRWLQTRYDSFLGGGHGRDQYHDVTLAGDADGRLRFYQLDVLADVGAYPHNGALVPHHTYSMGAGPYDIDRVEVTYTSVVTNRAATGVYRGAGRPEATFSLELAIERFARAAGLDPFTVRRRNLIRPEQFPYDNHYGYLYDSGNYEAALDVALTHLDLQALRAEQRTRLVKGDHRLLGVGGAVLLDRSGGAVPGGTEYAAAELTPAGRILVRVGSSSTGQGHATVFSQVAAREPGIDRDLVDVIIGDTGEIAQGTGSFASRSTVMAGSAVVAATRKLRRQMVDFAAAEMEIAATDLVIENGAVTVAGDPRSQLTFADIAARAGRQGQTLMAEELYVGRSLAMPSGFDMAVVEVDTDTGRIELRQLLAVDDCGNMINPMLVEGQLHGGLAQGIGAALFEEILYDDDGQPMTVSMGAYTIPSAADLPSYTTDHVVTPSPTNVLGVKGAGESGCLGAPPAIANAVLDALYPLGVEELQMPFTPMRVWRAIQDARSGTTSLTRPVFEEEVAR
jgi:carbon-monoxide dehydrogenase large subunit